MRGSEGFAALAAGAGLAGQGREPGGEGLSLRVLRCRVPSRVVWVGWVGLEEGWPYREGVPVCRGWLGGAALSLNHEMVWVGRDHRITESQNSRGWKGPLWVTQSRLHRTPSRRGWNISREGDSTASLGSLFQCSVTLRGKKFLLVFRRNFLCFSLCPLPLVLSLGTTEKSLAPSS